MKHDDLGSKLPVFALGTDNPETYPDRLNHYLALSFSLPERIARTLGSLIGGSTLLLTKTLLSKALKNSIRYRYTFGMFQAFPIKQVAQPDDFQTDTELQQHFLNRK